MKTIKLFFRLLFKGTPKYMRMNGSRYIFEIEQWQRLDDMRWYFIITGSAITLMTMFYLIALYNYYHY